MTADSAQPSDTAAHGTAADGTVLVDALEPADAPDTAAALASALALD